MSVDYADKGKPNKRKPTKKNRNSNKRTTSGARRNKPGQSKLPIVVLIVGGLLLVAFVVFLWLLKNNATDSESGGEPVVTPQAQFEDELPQAPEERWQYIHDLENREVEVIVPERAETQRRLMQCGSFRRQSDAETLRAQIAMLGHESQVRQTQSSEHGVWYRVILGPFENLRAAQSVNNQLRRGNVQGCQIWLWNLD
ncbi:cell division protein FtsN [Aliidiomarina minuta]|uniref:Cell division protein FtsN n=1 Tax=Aliidiomarina minuta TaxID=880057 RepID=A0A432W3H7_9GAMM|nr:SPOR domain-containing protein [Aliidiomarina minuta]RUO23881.1 cell division protein FtsN [Aliidiomarina minuta]